MRKILIIIIFNIFLTSCLNQNYVSDIKNQNRYTSFDKNKYIIGLAYLFCNFGQVGSIDLTPFNVSDIIQVTNSSDVGFNTYSKTIISSFDNSNFIIVGVDQSINEGFGYIYDANLNLIQDRFIIGKNDTVLNNIGVSVLPNNNFVSVYSSSLSQIKAQIYSQNLTLINDTFFISNGQRPMVTKLDNGGFAVAYAKLDNELFFKIFDELGNVILPETLLQVNFGNINYHLASLNQGKFCITYDFFANFLISEIFFDNGTQSIQINTSTALGPDPYIFNLMAPNFVIMWQDLIESFGEILNTNGDIIQDQFEITTDLQGSLTSGLKLSNNNFIALYKKQSNPFVPDQIRGLRFNFSAQVQGIEFVISNISSSNTNFPLGTRIFNDSFVVVWNDINNYFIQKFSTLNPTQSPTQSPSMSPSNSPSISPSISPTQNPSISPSNSPSISPSISPTQNPSISPSNSPSLSPSISPTQSPSMSPSDSPSISPSISPTQSPSISPSNPPSLSPSLSPTQSPSISPSNSPSISPSISPTQGPSMNPSNRPTMAPTLNPTISSNFSAIGFAAIISLGFILLILIYIGCYYSLKSFRGARSREANFEQLELF